MKNTNFLSLSKDELTALSKFAANSSSSIKAEITSNSAISTDTYRLLKINKKATENSGIDFDVIIESGESEVTIEISIHDFFNRLKLAKKFKRKSCNTVSLLSHSLDNPEEKEILFSDNQEGIIFDYLLLSESINAVRKISSGMIEISFFNNKIKVTGSLKNDSDFEMVIMGMNN